MKDTRWLIFIFFAVMVDLILKTPGFARTWVHFAAASGALVLTDLILSAWLYGRPRFPLSGVVSSFGVAVMIDSPVLWPTLIAAVLASSSKHLFQARGRHVFNPNNFGVVMTTLAFPDWAVVGGMRWGGDVGFSLLLFAIGALIVFHANRWILAFSYIFSFLFIAGIRATVLGIPPWAFSVSLLGPAMQLFIFFMISDPKTSPGSRRDQLIFGFVLATVDNGLRFLEFKDAPLLALFILCGLRAVPYYLPHFETIMPSRLTLSKP